MAEVDKAAVLGLLKEERTTRENVEEGERLGIWTEEFKKNAWERQAAIEVRRVAEQKDPLTGVPRAISLPDGKGGRTWAELKRGDKDHARPYIAEQRRRIEDIAKSIRNVEKFVGLEQMSFDFSYVDEEVEEGAA